MKRPGITKGEWQVKTNSMWNADDECYIGVDINDEGDGWIVFETIEYSTDEDKANAKAISAVPDMIDALLAVNHAIENCKGNSGAVFLGDRLEYGIKETLKKAGCTK